MLEGYGLSETSPVACFNHPDRERKPGSIGTPVEGVEMRLVDDPRQEVRPGEVGEIAIRGHNVMKGYWNRPDATAEAIDADGWFYSGDIARVDEDGCYYIVDRKKELIIRGGYNVYPREIEEVLYEHPAVREAAVIGIPHAELGEEVGAAVALKPGAQVDRVPRCATSSRRTSPPTSTRGTCGSSTSCRRAPPARSSSARSRLPIDHGVGKGARSVMATTPATPERRPAQDRDGSASGLAGRARRAAHRCRRRAAAAPGASSSRPPPRRPLAGLARRPAEWPAGSRTLGWRARGVAAGRSELAPARRRPALRRPGVAGELAPAADASVLPGAGDDGRWADRRRRARLAHRAPGAVRRRQRPRRARADATSRGPTRPCSERRSTRAARTWSAGARRFAPRHLALSAAARRRSTRASSRSAETSR